MQVTTSLLRRPGPATLESDYFKCPKPATLQRALGDWYCEHCFAANLKPTEGLSQTMAVSILVSVYTSGLAIR
jgi:hypothetical protein